MDSHVYRVEAQSIIAAMVENEGAPLALVQQHKGIVAVDLLTGRQVLVAAVAAICVAPKQAGRRAREALVDSSTPPPPPQGLMVTTKAICCTSSIRTLVTNSDIEGKDLEQEAQM